MGLSVFETDELDIGFILDMFTVKINDISEPEEIEATQEHFDNF